MSIVSVRNGDISISSQDEVGVIAGDYATQSYVNSAISSLIDGAPASLDTLNELAAALSDDSSFSSTVVLKAGSTMTGDLILNADPTANLGAATKQYVDNNAGEVTLAGSETLTNKTIVAPYLENLYSSNNYKFNTAFTYGPFIPYSSQLVLSNWQDPVDHIINVTQFATPEEKNIFRIDAHNSGTSVNAGSFITNKKYVITSVGTTDFTAIGASDNSIERVFTATGAGSGTGTADTWDTGEMRTDFSIKGGDDRGVRTGSEIISGIDYEILTVGTTDFTTIGSPDNNVGTIFTSTGTGSGTGTAIDQRHYSGDVNQFGSFTSASATPHSTRLGLLGYRISMYGPTDGYTFPPKDGSADQVIKTDGSGVLRFEDAETITLATLKSTVAASSDFADFQTRIAAL